MVLGRKKGGRWSGAERRAAAKVLIVNDDPDACTMLVRMIGYRGYRALGATTSHQANVRINDDLPRCIVLDLSVGGIGTSLKLLDSIRSHPDRRINTARVVLCAASPKNRTFSFQSGADSFVVRPFHLDDLLAQIADVLARPHDAGARHRRDELARHAD